MRDSVRFILIVLAITGFQWELSAQDSLAPAPPTGMYELSLPSHWRAVQYADIAEDKLLVAGIENDFDDYASLFFLELQSGGKHQNLFSLELSAPVPTNSDFHLMAIRKNAKGNIEVLGHVTQHKATLSDSLIRYEITPKGKILRRTARFNRHKSQVTKMGFQKGNISVIGKTPDETGVETGYYSLLNSQLQEMQHQDFSPHWIINDLVFQEDGSTLACGYLPFHGALLATITAAGEMQAAAPGFLEGNAIQFITAGEKVNLLMQGVSPAVQAIQLPATPTWHTDLDGTLSILGNWAVKPAISLPNGDYIVITSEHKGNKQEILRLHRMNRAGEVVAKEDFGPYEEVKGCYVQSLSDGRIRVMTYIRDAWDWNLHVLETLPNGTISQE